jgi:hypothetical protein
MLGSSRQFAGNDGYDDLATRHYSFDSTVPNSARVETGDLAVVRDSDGLIGVGWIDQIDEWGGEKLRRRCPVCLTTALKARSTKRPRYRCDHGHEFEEPTEELLTVTLYRARYAATWNDLPGLLSADELGPLYRAGAKQHAIRELRLESFREALQGRGALESDGWWNGYLL